MTHTPSKEDGTPGPDRVLELLREINQKLDHIIYRLSEDDPRTTNRRYCRKASDGEGPGRGEGNGGAIPYLAPQAEHACALSGRRTTHENRKAYKGVGPDPSTR